MAKIYYKPPLDCAIIKQLEELKGFDLSLQGLTKPKLIEFAICFTHGHFKKKKELKEKEG